MSNVMQIKIPENMVTLSQISDKVRILFAPILSDNRQKITAEIKGLLNCDIAGSADEFHNIVTHLIQNDVPDLAVLLVQKGIEKHPNNIDLYADLLSFLTKLGDYHNAALVKEMLFTQFPDFQTWNWRAYTYVLNYFISFKPDDYYEKSNSLIKEFRSYHPYDERSYMAEYNLLKANSKNDEAVGILETAIGTLIVAPQCALTLSDEYLDRGEYKKAISACNKAVYCSAESQASVKISYIFYNRALAKDAILNQSMVSNEPISADEVISAIKDYSLALKLHLNYNTESNAKDRINILKILFDIDYDKYNLEKPNESVIDEDFNFDTILSHLNERVNEIKSEEA